MCLACKIFPKRKWQFHETSESFRLSREALLTYTHLNCHSIYKKVLKEATERMPTTVAKIDLSSYRYFASRRKRIRDIYCKPEETGYMQSYLPQRYVRVRECNEPTELATLAQSCYPLHLPYIPNFDIEYKGYTT